MILRQETVRERVFSFSDFILELGVFNEKNCCLLRPLPEVMLNLLLISS